MVTPLNTDGPMRTLHRDKLLDARELVPDMEAYPSQESRITTTMTRSTALPNEQDDDDFEVGLLRITRTVDHVGRDMATPFETTREPQEHVDIQQDRLCEEDHSTEPCALRRSARQTAGQHSIAHSADHIAVAHSADRVAHAYILHTPLTALHLYFLPWVSM